MSKVLKKITFRYFKSFIFNFIATNQVLANKYRLYNKTINYNKIAGEELINIKDQLGQIFIAKKFKNILVAENTGCSLLENQNIYKKIDEYDGITNKNWVKISIKPKPIKELSGTAINLIGVHKGSKHYFHIFFDYIIPLLFFLNKNQNKDQIISILVRKDYNKVQKELYELITENFKNVKFIFVEKNEFIKCQELIFIYYSHKALYDYQRNSCISETITSLRNMLLKKYHIKEKQFAKKDLIYVSRKKARLRRTINEKSFKSLLNKNGFKTVILEDLSFKEQIDCFFNAKFVIATHGAGLLNLIFAQKGLHFIEIFPKKFRGTDFLRIANIMNLNRFVYYENNEIIWQCFYLRIKKIMPKIDEILLAIENR